MPTNAELVDVVKAHAYAHYSEGGWDYVIETMTDSEISKCIRRCTTIEDAIKTMAGVVGLWDDVRSEVANDVDTEGDY